MIEKRPGFGNNRRRSQGMVEFALALPVLLLLMFGIIEFGRLLFTFSAVFTASREAARIGASVGSDRNDASGNPIPYYMDCEKMREAARRLGSIAGVGDADIDIRYDRGVRETNPFESLTRRCLVSGPVNGGNPLTADDIAMGDRVVVRVSVTFQPIVPFLNVGGTVIRQTTPRLIVKKVEVARNVTPPSTPIPSATITPTPTQTHTPTNTSTNTPTITGTPYTPTPTNTATNTPIPTIKPNQCKLTPGTAEYCTPVPSSTPTLPPTITLTPTPDCSFVKLGAKSYSSQYSNMVVIDTYNTSSFSVTLNTVSIAWGSTTSHLKRIDFGAPLPNTPVPTPNRTLQPTETKVPTLPPIVNTIWSGTASSPFSSGVSGPNLSLPTGGVTKPLEFAFDTKAPPVGQITIVTNVTVNGTTRQCTVSTN